MYVHTYRTNKAALAVFLNNFFPLCFETECPTEPWELTDSAKLAGQALEFQSVTCPHPSPQHLRSYCQNSFPFRAVITLIFGLEIWDRFPWCVCSPLWSEPHWDSIPYLQFTCNKHHLLFIVQHPIHQRQLGELPFLVSVHVSLNMRK